MDIKHTLPWTITDSTVIVDRSGRAILYSSLRYERPGERVAITQLAAAAPALLAACEAAREAIASLPIDALGEGRDGEMVWPVRDELADHLTKAINEARGEP